MTQSFTHLIALTRPQPSLQTRESLDVALVSASYDINTAVFLSDAAAFSLRATPDTCIEQAFAMLEDFSVALFAESAQHLYGQSLQAISLTALRADCRHIFSFPAPDN